MSSRGRPPKNGTPFDRLLKKQCQKGVGASKSAGVVGKWGSASFTSIRSATAVFPGLEGNAAVSRPKKFFKSKNPESNDFEPIDVKPLVVKPPSKFFKSKAGAAQPLIIPQQQPQQLVKPKSVPPPPPLRPLEVTPNQQPQKPQQKEKEVMKVPPLKLRLKAGTLVIPVTPDSPEDEEASDDDLSSERSEEEDFKEPPLVETPSSRSNSSLESSPNKNYSPVRQTSPARNISPPVPVRAPSPPAPLRLSPDKVKSPERVQRTTRVSRMVEPVRSLAVDNNGDNPAFSSYSTSSYGNNGAQPRSYTRRQPLKRTEDKPVKPVTSIEQEQQPAEPVTKKIREESEGLIKDYSLPTRGSSVQETMSSDDVGLTRLSTKSASVATDMFVASEIMAPPGAFKPKKSIFKSKSQTGANGAGQKKGLSLYKHKFGASQDKETEEFRTKVFPQADTVGIKSGMDFDDFGGPSPSDMSFSANKLTRVTSEASSLHPDQTMQEVTSVKCPKAQKDYFTVIKNVKKAHQIQDSGEFQEFNDDVEYIMDGLGKHNNLSTRCLSTVTLASKCMEPPFRMHLRAHGTMNRFFAELRDAPKNPSLALCSATVLFVLSQDRLNMDMDRDSLELMLNLLDTDSRLKDALDGAGMNKRELEKNKQKVQDLCSAMKAKGHATNLSIEHISADHLSMETLLSLTSKRAGEWFKEELRELGGLDHLVKTMSDCVNFLMADEITMWTEPLHNKLRKAGRVLKVLESVTHENEENSQYLLEYQSGKFLDLIHKLFKLLDEEVPLNTNLDINDRESIANTLRESLFGVMRVYINLVHDYKQTSFGSRLSGEKSDTFDIILHCLFVMPNYLPVEKTFDLLVFTLTLIINLVEHCEPNREFLLKTKVPLQNDDLFSGQTTTAAAGLVQLFLQKEENAKREETKTDAILDGVKDEEEEEAKKAAQEEERKKTEQEVIDETVAKLLQKAGRHMEDTLIASYITLIMGYLILNNKEHEEQVRSLLPEKNFSGMASVLKKFFNFMNLTASSTVASNRGIKATEMILQYLEKIDKPVKIEVKNEESLDDLTLFDMTKDSDTSISCHQAPNTSNFDMDNFDKL